MIRAFPRSASADIDLDVFVAAGVKILVGYPDDCIRYVCDPVVGIPSKLKFWPSLAELRAACDSYMAPIIAEHRRRESIRALREATETTESASPEAREAAFQRWQAERREIGGDRPEETPESLDRKLEMLRGQPLPKLSDAARKIFTAEKGPQDE